MIDCIDEANRGLKPHLPSSLRPSEVGDAFTKVIRNEKGESL